MQLDKDVYFKKSVTFRAWKHSFEFRIPQDLFSSNDIDLGTKFLLRTLVEAQYKKPAKILDLGCGYGPLGLVLGRIFEDSPVHMVDRDALAVDYSRQNAVLNGLTHIDVYGSLGYDDLKTTDFGLIVSNIPGKAGESVISSLLKESSYYLVPDGIAAVVVVTPLEQLVEKIFRDSPEINVLLKRTRPGHSVFHYQFKTDTGRPRPNGGALERGVYDRTNAEFRAGSLKFPMRSAYGLPEFDSLSFSSELALKVLEGLPKTAVRRAAVFHPGQGHLAVAVWKLFRPERLALIDRDLLALRYSRINLNLNNCPVDKVSLFHQCAVTIADEGEADLVVIRLREESREVNNTLVKQAAEILSEKGMIVVSASSTAGTRLVDDFKGILGVKSTERWRGNSVLVLGKKG